ncbi:dihydroorotate dehydrogenase electron transfer subunit [Oceanobacillus halotolerans]|uniref:dihydroorotate dehydrogenase electron transfer subunit n=1 Tax=Oceanobacillus halotolerans TaxID=2663380 RepID=UPI001969EF53|nr:dihydroorotate dehydrogenase electron transfer subunit [Oceanobacillus halotolerans]
MQKETVTVKSSKTVALNTTELILQNEYLSQSANPGQFIHVYIDGFMLRRPISIADVNKKEQTITILFKQSGKGTEKIASYQPGNMIDVLGPCGNGFPLESTDDKILLIGGGIGVPPLYYFGKKMSETGKEIISILGFQSKKDLFYEQEFQQLGTTYIVTNDGTYGDKGFVTSLFNKLENYDSYYACGPIPMLKAVKKELPNKVGYLSIEERMGCGIGACFACVIPTTDQTGYKKICKDGPVFSAQEVLL